MVDKLALRGRQIAFKIITFQLIVGIIAGLIALIYSNIAAISIVIGAVVCVFPNILFALIVFKNAGAIKSKLVVKSFYIGESIKFFLTLVLFLFIFKYMSVLPGLVILGYTITLIANWLAIGRFRSVQY